MIDRLDLLLGQTLKTSLPQLADRIGFQPPDDTWRQRVGAGTGVWLNCALVDLREVRHRRSTGVRVTHDPPRRARPPFLLCCHYLLSAWSSAKDCAAVAASVAEHALLGQVVATLAERGALTPAEVLTPDELAQLPAAWREADLDTGLLPPEGFPKVAEFWGTLGRAVAWRPVVWLAVTVPVVPEPSSVDGVVTTLLTSMGPTGGPVGGPTEVLAAVGGLVEDAAGPHAGSPVPVPQALVTLTDSAGRLRARARSRADGSFVLDGVPPGDYLVTARAPGHTVPRPEPVTVPVPTGGPLRLRFT
ncbi:Pvc16 family protein [Streptomyces sp. NPDC005931]|uniref:Pvc16 family protein n=1 Tax=Streptomyces sp. NPDC005931 TaxID=3364737 RepID=UPI0036945092